MNLVPENINEAIKHLKPRTKEEIEDVIHNMSNIELYNVWAYAEKPNEEKLALTELKRRGNSSELDDIFGFYRKYATSEEQKIFKKIFGNTILKNTPPKEIYYMWLFNKASLSNEKISEVISTICKSYEQKGYSIISTWENLEYRPKYTDQKLLHALGKVLPWYTDNSKILHEFWEKHHTWWSREVIVLRKDRKLYLGSLVDDDIIEINIKINTPTL
jgi:hypothetical protein